MKSKPLTNTSNGLRVTNFSINSLHVIHETIDDEIVIIHLLTGNYFSLEKSGRAIWQLLEQAYSVEEILQWLCVHYAAPPETLATSLNAFINELNEQQLLEPIATEPDAKSAAVRVSSNGSPQPFEPPNLQTFSDMQDLLLLDPIHDVDEMGWPHPKVDSTN